MNDFEAEVKRDIDFLTGLSLVDPVTAILGAISEETRLSICMNDDLTFQLDLGDRWRQLFIADPQALSPDRRRVVPQLILARDISKDLKHEMGWLMAVVEDIPLGSMTLEEQQVYLSRFQEIAEEVRLEELDARVKELTHHLVGY